MFYAFISIGQQVDRKQTVMHICPQGDWRWKTASFTSFFKLRKKLKAKTQIAANLCIMTWQIGQHICEQVIFASIASSTHVEKNSTRAGNSHDASHESISEELNDTSALTCPVVRKKMEGEHYYVFIHVNDTKNISRGYALCFWREQTIKDHHIWGSLASTPTLVYCGWSPGHWGKSGWFLVCC